MKTSVKIFSRYTQHVGIQWLKKHPVLAAVVWLFGKSAYSDFFIQQPQAITSSTSPSSDIGNEDKASSKSASDSAIQTQPINMNEKRLSWSDEHGKSLVEYMGQHHTKVLRQCKVSKSALKRCKSGDLISDSAPVPFCHPFHEPKKMHIADAKKGCDVISFDPLSPQWGWYVNITPPKEEYGDRVTRMAKSC